jgi:hypothetical protein
MATLKLTPKYFNTYEAAHNILSKNDLFRQTEWERWSKKGELDQYITVLANTDKLGDKLKFREKYMLDYADDKTVTAAMYNELFADKTNVDEEREGYAKDENGNFLLDNDGNLLLEKYKASDYEHRKRLILDANTINYQKYLQEQEQERKNSIAWYDRFVADVGGVASRYVGGVLETIDATANTIAGISNGIAAVFQGKSFADAYVETAASDTWRLFENLGVEDWLVDFERRYTNMRDINGNPTWFGKYIGEALYSLGQMLPAMIVGNAAGSIAKGAGATAKTVGAVSKASSTLLFYGSMTTNNIREIYQQMAKDAVSVPSGAILNNAVVKSSLQWLVEVGLGKILGGTALDNMVFGRATSAGTSKTLAKAGAKRLFSDFVTEGFEEVLQDTSDFLVDRAFSVFIQEFADITELTPQSLIDAFVIGGIASISGSAVDILTTKREETPNIKLDKDGNAVYDKNGEPVLQKLDKLSSWEYGLDMQSFMRNFSILQEQGKGLIKQYDVSKSDEGKEYAAAFTEMYAAYRMIGSIYSEIGDERFQAANSILNEITAMINRGKFNSATLKNVSSEVLEHLQGMKRDSLKIAKEKLLKAAITQIVTAVERGDDLVNLPISDEAKKELEELFKGDDSIQKIVLSEDGNNIVLEGNVMFVPMNYANKVNAATIYETVAEQTLVENIIKGNYKGLPLQTVTSIFRQVSGKENATTEEAVYNLIFNDSFFRLVLSTANKDTYNFVASLLEIEQSVVPKKLRDAIYKQKISIVVKNMTTALYDYLINQPFADYKLDIFTKEQQTRIAAARWCKNLYARVIDNSKFKKLSDNDWQVLQNRINSLPVNQSEKDIIFKNLHSEHSSTRSAAMNRIAMAYAGVFTSKYDGKIYMPDTSIPNRTFNMFLQNNGLTIDTLIDMNVDTSVKTAVTQLYGEFTEENLIKFRQSQFMRTCSNKYTFRYNKQGKIGVYEASTNKQVGFSTYNSKADSLLAPTALDKRTTVDKGSKKNYLVKDLLNSNVDNATASYLSIDDVINDPSLLNEQHQANIQLKYGDVNIETTFMYLRDYFLNIMNTTTVIVLQDGSYAFGDVRPMLLSLKSKNLTIDKNTRITQLIKPAYLYGRLADVKLKLTDRSIIAEYNAAENTIYVNSIIANKGGDLLTFAFLHEFQHAIQVENSMNIGINAKWIRSKYISKSVRQNIINDIRKHRPELFENITKGSDTELEIVNDFVYFSSGESTALGLDASKLIDYYPTIVKTVGNSTSIVFSWGTKYNITEHVPMSLVSKFGKFDIPMTKKEREFYKLLASTAYKEIVGNAKHSRILNLFEGFTDDEFVTTFLRILSVTDDSAFLKHFYKYLDDNLPYNEETLESDYDYALSDCYHLLNERLAELQIFAKGIQDVDKVVDMKTYSANELRELFFKYNTNISIEQFAKNVFDTFMQLNDKFPVDIKVVQWLDKDVDADGNRTVGFYFVDLLRYGAVALSQMSRRRASELYLHEAIHFVTTPLIYEYQAVPQALPDTIRNRMNCLNNIYNEISKIFDKTIFSYRVSDLHEFFAARSDQAFMKKFHELNKQLPTYLRLSVENISNKFVDTYYDAYIALMNDMVSDIGYDFNYEHWYTHKNMRYEQLMYQETHDGNLVQLYQDANTGNYYRIDDNTGEVIFKGEPNYEYSSSLGPFEDVDSNMSLKKANVSDTVSVHRNAALVLLNAMTKLSKENSDLELGILYNSSTGETSNIIVGKTKELRLSDVKPVNDKKYDTLLHTHPGRTVASLSYNDIFSFWNGLNSDAFNNLKNIGVLTITGDIQIVDFSNLTKDQITAVKESIDQYNTLYADDAMDKMYDTRLSKQKIIDVLSNAHSELENAISQITDARVDANRIANKMLFEIPAMLNNYESFESLLNTIVDFLKMEFNDKTIALKIEQLFENYLIRKFDLDTILDTEFRNEIKTKLSEVGVNTNNMFLEMNIEETKSNSMRKKRYVSQKRATGTNLEKFGYTAKYKKTQLSPELQSFIVNATENIDSELWDKVKSGKITTQDIMDYFRDSKTIDDATFKLINDSFFHNDKIKTFEQLEDFVDDKTAKYYAMRAVIKNVGLGDMLLTNTNPNLLENFLKIIDKDEKLKKLYDQIHDRYYTYKKFPIIISTKNLRRLWMQYFDGSAQTGGYIAAIAKAGAINKWLITGEGSTRSSKSLNDNIAEDLQLEETLEDTSSVDAFEAIFYSTTREQRVEEIMKIAGPRYIKKLMSRGANQRQATAAYHKKWEQLMDMDDKEFAKQYAKIVKNMSEEEINNLFAKQLIAESAGLDITKLNDEELNNLTIVTEKTLGNTDRPSSAIVNNIRSIVRTIKSNLSSKDRTRFLKENSDIFDSNLNIKTELLRQKNDKGVERYLDPERLLPLEDRIRKLSKDVRAKVYESTRSLNFKKQMDKQIKRLERENAKLVEKLATGKISTVQAVTYEIADETITIDTKKQIPAALTRILANEFNKIAKSKTQYLIEGDKVHIQTNLKKFINDNATLLNALTQSDVDEIIDFYSNSEILPSTNKARQYSAIQVYLMTYLIKGNKIGQFVLTEEQSTALNERLENIVSLSASNLSNWKAAMKMLKPAEIIVQSLARSCDIEFSVGDVENLISAVESADIGKINAAKQKMYENGLRQYNGIKTSFLNKLLKFERMAMLSGPGTIVRNKVSNALVAVGNLTSEQVGTFASSIIEKVFPKKKWRRDNQYKIVGTKVTSEVKTFIQTNILDNGFFELVKDGLNKYDTRQTKSDDLTTEESITKLIVESIKSKIFQENASTSPILNTAQKFVLSLLSDDKSINKAAIRYFGKMLVEDNIDLSHGLSNDVMNCFAEAYKLAAFDYMHKPNFFNKIEAQMKQEWGDGAYFIYKQLFPFASASWNWFAEGINYTPIGLIKAIVNFAKLENTIEKMDLKRQRGEQIVSSRFAEYLAKRNIGKGIIGSIGTLIGIALAAFGFAGIDEEDEKYKLFVNIADEKVTVDISDLFGTQGILLGITIISASKDGNWIAAIGDTLDTMFLDSTFSDLFNSFRYSDSFGDWLSAQPFSFLEMFVPNFFKTLSSVVSAHKIKYSSGILGKIEKLIVQAIPGLSYAFPKQVDPYTGENQIAYKMWFVTGLANKLLPFKIYPYNVTNLEKEAIAVGVRKGQLTGRYTINGEEVVLNTQQLQQLNEYYGKLNKKDLEELVANKRTYKVWDDSKRKYVELKYNKMSDKQKKTVIERIMSDNGQVAKVYILTSLNWKYYASEAEYTELKKLGIKNIYKKNAKLEGFEN